MRDENKALREELARNEAERMPSARHSVRASLREQSHVLIELADADRSSLSLRNV